MDHEKSHAEARDVFQPGTGGVYLKVGASGVAQKAWEMF